ncbi:MAG: ParB/RepB/Spo0J family partition protein [Nocardioidaceae bacterium]
MSSTHRGLGRGIGALIPGRPDDESGLAPSAVSASGHRNAPSGLPPVPGAFFTELPVSSIRPNARQPRAMFDEHAMAELVASIEAVGLLQPVVVRSVADGSYELIMGERRWRAVQAAGLSSIAAIVKETSDDAMLRSALLENLHRAELNPLEEAAAYQQLLDDFGCTHDELAARIGRSRPHITNTIRLLRLSPPVQRRVAAGVLSAGHARALLALDAEADQESLARRAVAEGMSVRTLEEMVTLGTRASPRRSPRVARARPELDAVAVRLSERLETRCSVVMGKHKGRIVVEFADGADLDRLLTLLEA